MLKVRLARTGKKLQSSYRIVVAETRSKRDSRSVDIIGHYQPSLKNALSLDRKKLEYWQKRGAQITTAIRNLINHEKLA